MKSIYWGIFVPNMGGRLDKVVIFQHITFGFKTEFPEELRGKLVDNIQIIGYANDGTNEAFEVQIPEWMMKKYYSGASISHITLSTSWDGKPVDSCKLNFQPIVPFNIEGMFGYFDEGGIHL